MQDAAAVRFGPVLTTTVALAALALPFVVLGARPGLEILHRSPSSCWAAWYHLRGHAVPAAGGSTCTSATRPGRRQRIDVRRPADLDQGHELAPASSGRGQGRECARHLVRGTAAALATGLWPDCCARSRAEQARRVYEPATVESTSPDGPKRVTFTEDGAKRVGLATSGAYGGRRHRFDYAALIYDKRGSPGSSRVWRR